MPALKGIPKSEEHKKKIGLANAKALKGKKLTYEHKRNISLSKLGKARLNIRGEKSTLWKGGLSTKNQMIRSSLEYRQWRTSVFERDNYTCQECKKRGIKLNADHMKAFAHYPELRFDITNGRTLCVDCHKKTPNFGGKYYKNRVPD